MNQNPQKTIEQQDPDTQARLTGAFALMNLHPTMGEYATLKQLIDSVLEGKVEEEALLYFTPAQIRQKDPVSGCPLFLYFIMEAAHQNTKKIEALFNKVWGSWAKHVTLEDCRSLVNSPRFNNISVLWLLTWQMCDKGDSLNILQPLWDQLGLQITAEDMRFSPKNQQELFRQSQNHTVSYVLADALWRSRLVREWWSKWAERLVSLEDLMTPPAPGQPSMLWLLAFAATRDEQPFLRAWNKFQSQIPVKRLRYQAEREVQSRADGSTFQWAYGEDKSILYLLASSVAFPHLLQTLPSIGNAADLASRPSNPKSNGPWPTLLEELRKRSDWDSQIRPLIQARNAFFAQLNFFNTNPTANDYGLLKEKAKAAADAGYVNAMYDLGQFFEKRGLAGEASLAYAQIPEQSAYVNVKQRHINLLFKFTFDHSSLQQRTTQQATVEPAAIGYGARDLRPKGG